MRASSALVDIRAGDAVALQACGARATEGARKVGAIVFIIAVVCTCAAFVNLRARRRGAEVATHASACAIDKMRRVRWAGEAIGGCAAAASGAARVAHAATAARGGIIRRRAGGEAGSIEHKGSDERTRSTFCR